MNTTLLSAAHQLATDSGRLHYADGATCVAAGPVYRTLAGMGDSAEMLRARGADATISDDALLEALDKLGAQVSARWSVLA